MARLALFMALMLSVLLVGCEKDNGSESEDFAYLEIHLLFSPPASGIEITRLVITVSAPDMEIREIEIDISDKKSNVPVNVPAGENRLLTVKAYSGTEVAYEGEKLIKLLEAGNSYPIEVSMEPAKLSIEINPSGVKIAKGDTFAVDVKVGNAKRLFGCSYEMEYDGNILEPVSSTPGDFLGNDVLFIHEVDKDKNLLSIGITRKAGAGPVNGSGTLARVTFRGLNPGDTLLDFAINDDFVFYKEDGSLLDEFQQMITKGCVVVVTE